MKKPSLASPRRPTSRALPPGPAVPRALPSLGLTVAHSNFAGPALHPRLLSLLLPSVRRPRSPAHPRGPATPPPPWLSAHPSIRALVRAARSPSRHAPCPTVSPSALATRGHGRHSPSCMQQQLARAHRGACPCAARLQGRSASHTRQLLMRPRSPSTALSSPCSSSQKLPRPSPLKRSAPCPPTSPSRPCPSLFAAPAQLAASPRQASTSPRNRRRRIFDPRSPTMVDARCRRRRCSLPRRARRS
jgi:hypothetical protein